MDVFLIEDDDLLKKYNTIQDKLSADIKKEFDSKPVYNKEYSKTKIKSNGDEVAGFYDKKIPKGDSSDNCLAVTGLDPALKKDESYYTQVFFKKCKYDENNVIRHIHDNLKDYFYSSGESDESDEEQIKVRKFTNKNFVDSTDIFEVLT